jgi:hypothetical protein
MRGGARSVGAVAMSAALACLLASSCAGSAIIDCAGPGVNVDLRDVGSHFPRAGTVTGCADSECVTYRPGPDGATEHYLFLPLRTFGVVPKTITVTVTENGRKTFSAASSQQFSAHHGGQCSNGLFFVRVDSSGKFHPSGP